MQNPTSPRSPRSDRFEVRTQSSFSNNSKHEVVSDQSHEMPANDISQIIQNILNEQKKKYSSSKTDNRMMRTEANVKTRRYFSVSNVKNARPVYQLPLNIDKLLVSTKKYPNVPLLDENEEQLDKIYGAFFGFLIGDIAGAYMAYTSNEPQKLIPNALLLNGGGTYNLGAGQGTDQTELMFTLAYALIEGQGIYNQNFIAKKYLEWFQTKPFNFSAIFALAIRDIRKTLGQGKVIDEKKYGKMLTESSQKNLKQESSIGLIRILPLTLYSLRFNQTNFEALIKDQLRLICPNQLVIESGIAYAKILRCIFLTKDEERAFYQASKWVYENGGEKMREIWKIIQRNIEIPSRGNMGKLKTSFTYACIEINKREMNFVQSLISILAKGGDTETNCAIVMTLVGAIIGYNAIPGYFKQKIINSRMKDSPRPRDQKYSPHMVIDIIQNLIKLQNPRYFCIH